MSTSPRRGGSVSRRDHIAILVRRTLNESTLRVDDRSVSSSAGGSEQPAPSVSLCIVCHDRPRELLDALGSAAAETWHEIVVLDMASSPPVPAVEGTTWLRSETNLGVTAGRNRLARAAIGEVLVFLDDDAVFLSSAHQRVRDSFRADRSLGALAFRVRRPGAADPSLEHPFRGRRARGRQVGRECAYFVGCGYAIRRRAHLEVGGYDDRFFYSTEEVDLAFRLMRDGWRIHYDPAVEVEHRPSYRGRGSASEVEGWRIRNRLLLVRAHLPVVIAVPHGLVWALRTGVAAARQRDLRRWWQRVREGLSLPVERRPLPWSVLARAHRLGGRVLY